MPLLLTYCYASSESECIINIRLTSYSYYFAAIKIRLTFNLKLYGNFCA